MSPLRKRLAPVVSLLLAIMMMNALARLTGGSVSVHAAPQNSPFCDDIPAQSTLFRAERPPFCGGAGADIAVLLRPLITQNCSALPCTDGAGAARAAEEIREFLLRLPPGLMDAVSSEIGSVVFVLCGGIRAAAPLPDSPRACVCCGEVSLVLIDVSADGLAHTLAHEIAHLAVRALDEASLRDGSRWNDALWAELNPPGFQYSLSYAGSPTAGFTVEAGLEDAYFISRYSKTFRTEDAATLMEAYARLGPDSLIFKNAHIKRKLESFLCAVEYYLLPGR
ncbi:MAG: hypothetical protein IKG85_08820 [Clostridia bacterium]|nr:hypothetical protein [Clostridia bacterium]